MPKIKEDIRNMRECYLERWGSSSRLRVFVGIGKLCWITGIFLRNGLKIFMATKSGDPGAEKNCS